MPFALLPGSPNATYWAESSVHGNSMTVCYYPKSLDISFQTCFAYVESRSTSDHFRGQIRKFNEHPLPCTASTSWAWKSSKDCAVEPGANKLPGGGNWWKSANSSLSAAYLLKGGLVTSLVSIYQWFARLVTVSSIEVALIIMRLHCQCFSSDQSSTFRSLLQTSAR